MPVLVISSNSSLIPKPSWATKIDMVNPALASSDTPAIRLNRVSFDNTAALVRILDGIPLPQWKKPLRPLADRFSPPDLYSLYHGNSVGYTLVWNWIRLKFFARVAEVSLPIGAVYLPTVRLFRVTD